MVAHEYTHFAVRNHGPKFRALMDERLPGWQTLRRRLNRREWGETSQEAHPAKRAATRGAQQGAMGRKMTFVQTEFWE